MLFYFLRFISNNLLKSNWHWNNGVQWSPQFMSYRREKHRPHSLRNRLHVLNFTNIIDNSKYLRILVYQLEINLNVLFCLILFLFENHLVIALVIIVINQCLPYIDQYTFTWGITIWPNSFSLVKKSIWLKSTQSFYNFFFSFNFQHLTELIVMILYLWIL